MSTDAVTWETIGFRYVDPAGYAIRVHECAGLWAWELRRHGRYMSGSRVVESEDEAKAQALASLRQEKEKRR